MSTPIVLQRNGSPVVLQRVSTPVVVTRDGGTVVVAPSVEKTVVVVVAKQGPRGIQGIPGPAGGAAYTHTQNIPSAVWTIPHNLGRWPSVAVTDHLGNLIEPDVKYLDSNIVQVTHGAPLIGVAYCN